MTISQQYPTTKNRHYQAELGNEGEKIKSARQESATAKTTARVKTQTPHQTQYREAGTE